MARFLLVGCVLCLVLVLLLPVVTLATADQQLRLVTAACGSRIPIDSLFPVESWWALRSLTQWVNSSSTAGLTFGSTTSLLSHDALNALSRVTGIAGSHVTLFEIDGSRWANALIPCSVTWSPVDSLYLYATITAASIAVAPISVSSTVCPVTVSISSPVPNAPPQQWSFPVLPSSTTTALNVSSAIQQTVMYVPGAQWPATIAIGPLCKAVLVLAVNREIPIEPWWAWIPMTVYSGVVIPIILVTAQTAKHVSNTAMSLQLTLTFVGYLGCSIGLLIALVGWQVSVGRFFPFPSTVTLYAVMWAAYVALFSIALGRHPCRSLLLNAAMRAMIYGLTVAHVIAYWATGFVALGSVGLALILVTNFALIFLYIRFVSTLSTVRDFEEEFRSLPMSWLAPFSPFVPSLLMYADLFFAHQTPHHQLDIRLRDAVELFNVQTALPFIAVFVSGSVALLVAATTRQATLLVALFQFLFLAGWYTFWMVQQYASNRRKWRSENMSQQSMLWPAIQTLVDKYNREQYQRQQLAAVIDRSASVASALRTAGVGAQLPRQGPALDSSRSSSRHFPSTGAAASASLAPVAGSGESGGGGGDVATGYYSEGDAGPSYDPQEDLRYPLQPQLQHNASTRAPIVDTSASSAYLPLQGVPAEVQRAQPLRPAQSTDASANAFRPGPATSSFTTTTGSPPRPGVDLRATSSTSAAATAALERLYGVDSQRSAPLSTSRTLPPGPQPQVFVNDPRRDSRWSQQQPPTNVSAPSASMSHGSSSKRSARDVPVGGSSYRVTPTNDDFYPR